MNRYKTTIAATAVLLTALSLSAAPKAFDFKDAKGVNNVSFILDAPLEQIAGNARGVSGIVNFDPEAPEKTSGTITVATDTLTVTNDSMQDHMLGSGWLDAKSFPEITFAAKSLSKIEKTDKGIDAHLTGDFTLKGVSKELTVPVTLTYMPDMLGARTNGRAEGDLLVIRSVFTINRSEFGIKPGESVDKVAEEIELRLAIAGAAPDA
ncbi:MAG: YceI family protein [Verrucomicrobiota bacterium]